MLTLGYDDGIIKTLLFGKSRHVVIANNYWTSTNFRLELTYTIFVRGHERTKVRTKL